MKTVKAFALLLFILCLLPCRAAALPYIIEYLMEPPNADPETAAVWQGRLWLYVSVDKSEDDCSLRFKSLPVTKAEKPRDEFTARVPCTEEWQKPYLLNSGRRLWIISPVYVGYVEHKALTLIKSAQYLDNASKPFVFQELPAVFESRRRKVALLQLENGRWNEVLLFGIGEGEISRETNRRVQAVGEGDTLHIFWYLNGTLYHYRGNPGKAILKKNWTKVLDSDCTWRGWEAVDLNGTPAVFYPARKVSKDLQIKIYTDGAWHSIPMDDEYNIGLFGDYGFFPTGRGRDFVALVRNRGPALFAVFQDGKLKASTHFGSYSIAATINGTVISSAIIFLLWLLLEGGIKLFNPYWYYRIVTSKYIDSRTVPVEAFDVNEILSRSYPKKKPYVIRTWPNRKALTIRCEKLAEVPVHFERATLIFEEESAHVKVRMISKWSLSSWVLLLWGYVVIYSYGDTFRQVMGPAKTILILAPFAILALWVTWRLIKGASKKGQDMMKGDLDVILAYLGGGEKEAERKD